MLIAMGKSAKCGATTFEKQPQRECGDKIGRWLIKGFIQGIVNIMTEHSILSFQGMWAGDGTTLRIENNDPSLEDNSFGLQPAEARQLDASVPNVLVVEDEPNIAALVADIVQDHGYNVTITFDGRQGYELATRGDYALIITDVMLPYLTGYELCRKLKELPEQRHVRIVLMSAAEQLAGRMESSMADDFLVKPFNISDIDLLVERYLRPVTP
jgi:CheY-like chemotaxis protein